MKSASRHNQLSDVITSLLVLLFAYTGISKLIEHEIFQFQVFRATFSKLLAPLVAWGLPIFELIIAVLLILPKTKFIAFKISFILLVSFTLYIIGMLMFNSNLPCKCGGVIKQLGWKMHIVFNLAFVALTLKGILIERNKRSSANQELAGYQL